MVEGNESKRWLGGAPTVPVGPHPLAAACALAYAQTPSLQHTQRPPPSPRAFPLHVLQVLLARDRWLRPGGAMLPDTATIYMAGATAAALDLDFWEVGVTGVWCDQGACACGDQCLSGSTRRRALHCSGCHCLCAAMPSNQMPCLSPSPLPCPLLRSHSTVPLHLAPRPTAALTLNCPPAPRPTPQDVYGFSMAPIAEEMAAGLAGKALVQQVPASALATSTATLLQLDLTTCRPADQDFNAEFVLEAAGTGQGQQQVAALVLWFDTAFSARFCADNPVLLSTAPNAPTTHWVQTVLPVQAAVPLTGGEDSCSDGAVRLVGRLSMARSHHKHRQLDISVEYRGEGRGGEAVGAPQVAVFSMDVIGD